MVERCLAKANVAGPNPVSRSTTVLYRSRMRWHHSQVVRQRSAKPLCPGSNPGVASKYASVAQLVEQGTENPRVVGSIPTGGTILRI